MRPRTRTLAIVGLLILGALRAGAQDAADPSVIRATPGPIRLSLARLENSAPLPASAGSPTSHRRPSFGRRLLGGVAVGALGMALGAIVGAQIPTHCNCDDPRWAMFGASAGLIGGAALGASVGW